MKPLTLAFAGLEPEDITDFRRVFGKLRSELSADWRLVDDSDADLTVVDIDSIYGHMDWLKLTGSGRRVAIYTSARYAKESDLIVHKPVQTDRLAEILAVVAAEHGIPSKAPAVSAPEPIPPVQPDPASLVEATAAAVEPHPRAPAPATTPPEPAVVTQEIPAVRPVPAAPVSAPPAVAEPVVAIVDPAAADPETIGEWLLRGDIDHPVRLSRAGKEWIIDPDRDAYHGPSTLKPLGDLLSQPVSEIADADLSMLERARKEPAQPLSRLRWFAGLMSGSGELAPELAAVKSFGLSRWPQIEREFPRHFRIATAMMKEAGSLDELAASSGVPAADVADFINAGHAIGAIELGSSHQMAEEAPARGRVMSRLRHTLGR